MKTFDWYENILYEKNWYQKKLISKFAKFCSMNPMDVPKKLWGISKKKKHPDNPKTNSIDITDAPKISKEWVKSFCH